MFAPPQQTLDSSSVARQTSSPDSPTATGARDFARRLVAASRRDLILGATTAIAWLGAVSIAPWVLGQLVDAANTGSWTPKVVLWCSALVGTFATHITCATLRHYFAVHCFWRGSLYTKSLVGRRATEIGTPLGTQVGVGKCLSHSTNDAYAVGLLMDIPARGIGAAAVLAAVVTMSLITSYKVGLLMSGGVPLILVATTILTHRLHPAQQAHRTAMGQLTATAADGVSGLRTLQGFGGEAEYVQRWARHSATVRHAGHKLGNQYATVTAVRTALVGCLLTGVVWLGIAEVLAGRLTPGDVVAFFGWTSTASVALSYVVEAYRKIIGGRVALRELDSLLALPAAGCGQVVSAKTDATPHPPGNTSRRIVDGTARTTRPTPLAPASKPIPRAALVDQQTKVTANPGEFVGVVAAQQKDDRAVASRLAHVPADADNQTVVGDTLLTMYALDRVRECIGFSGPVPELTAGTLRSQVDPTGQRSDADCRDALAVAAAEDVLDETRGGLDERITERGRSLSGGQRQRVALARALLTERPVLVLVNPTSAVDSVTENRIADALRIKRQGLTTVIATTSPTLLDQCDVVYWVSSDSQAVRGTHESFMRRTDDVGQNYRTAVGVVDTRRGLSR